ncbi:excinuclease ABC subunit A [Comamonas sp. Y33R10-2]|uniref:excinuclease ABC subunit A n=1 Tax=Comamonas sp. Y33R10-2 TaxID=2853257 RepID=UPI001C5CA5A6|nr:excinuclease ABC subunit A [Comamonas sp. Y33R10-2]QXZ08880.1 excinuclease ABC subunit A [Comamonas sp. Y33R10-2]
MIFSNASLIESEKERNLCTKFFAGYFFNEFTAGYAKRIVHFNRYIQEVTGREDLALQSPNVSFDTHAYLCHERLRSKLSDVLISDPARQTFLFIETKYLTNWTYAADVAKGLERLDKVFDAEKKPHLANAKQHYFLLTSRRKEEVAERPVRSYPPVHLPIYVPTPVAAADASEVEAEAGKNSFTSLLYWEDLAQMCDRSEVRQYMEARLKLCVSSSRNQHKAGYFLPGA